MSTVRPVHFAWRRDSVVQHLAVLGRGHAPAQVATYCNKYWIRDHVLPKWEVSMNQPDSDRRPCLLCVGWLARNGGSWTPLLFWMQDQGARHRPNKPTARYLEAV